MHVGSIHSSRPSPLVPPPHFGHPPTNHLVQRFLPLDLSQPSAVYGLYAAAAAGHASTAFNPLLHSHFVAGGVRNLLDGVDRLRDTAYLSKESEERQHMRNSVVVERSREDLILPRNEVLRVAKADYFGCTQPLVSSSCHHDSDGSSSSGNSSSASSSSCTSRHTPPCSKLALNVIVQPASSPKPQPQVHSRPDNKHKKRKGVVRDEAYWERRRKNNDAAKRSRDSRRRKEDEVAVRAAILEQENMRLRFEVDRLRTEVDRHRSLAAFTSTQTIEEIDVEKLPAPSPLKLNLASI